MIYVGPSRELRCEGCGVEVLESAMPVAHLWEVGAGRSALTLCPPCMRQLGASMQDRPQQSELVLRLQFAGVLSFHPDRADALARALLNEADARTGAVTRACARMQLARRTLSRHMQFAGLPPATAWIRLGRYARAVDLMIHDGHTVLSAALRSGWPDAFTFSNALYRDTGLRPSLARREGWGHLGPLVDAWVARQRERGALQREAAA